MRCIGTYIGRGIWKQKKGEGKEEAPDAAHTEGRRKRAGSGSGVRV